VRTSVTLRPTGRVINPGRNSGPGMRFCVPSSMALLFGKVTQQPAQHAAGCAEFDRTPVRARLWSAQESCIQAWRHCNMHMLGVCQQAMLFPPPRWLNAIAHWNVNSALALCVALSEQGCTSPCNKQRTLTTLQGSTFWPSACHRHLLCRTQDVHGR
jgi:hypothetical protein